MDGQGLTNITAEYMWPVERVRTGSEGYLGQTGWYSRIPWIIASMVRSRGPGPDHPIRPSGADLHAQNARVLLLLTT